MPRSKYLWYRWSEGGRRFAVSLKTESLPEAIQKIQDIKAGRFLVQWETGTTPQKTVMTKLVGDYLKQAQERARKPMRQRTARKQGAVLLKFLNDTGIKAAWELNRSAIDGWLTGLKGKSADTVHTYARALHTFVAWLVEQRLASGDLLHKFDIPARAAVGRKNWLRNEEVQRVITASKDPALTFILFCGFHAGLRRTEIANAKVNWFDLDAGLLHVQNDPATGFVLKDRENRSIRLSPPFKELLKGYLTGRNVGEYVLKPETIQSRFDYRYDFSQLWESHMKRCGVKCTIHDARRSFASNLLSAGVEIYTVAKWLGDEVQIVERSYGHLAPSTGDIEKLAWKN